MLSRNHPDRIRIAFDDTRWKQPSVYSSLKGHPPCTSWTTGGACTRT